MAVKKSSMKNPRLLIGWFVIFCVFLAVNAWPTLNRIETLPYSELQELLRKDEVAELNIGPTQIQGRFRTPRPNGDTQFASTRIDPLLAGPLPANTAKIVGVVESTIVRELLSWVVPGIVFALIWVWLMRRMGARGGGLMSIGKSKAKVFVEQDTKVTFADVAGLGEAQTEVMELVHFLKSPAEYGRLGGRMPKGVLLVGPPGTGKTLLAKAVAGEAAVPFFSISGSEFVEMFVGVGAARVRDLFEQARLKSPCIIFIDELDALGKARSQSPFGGGQDEREQTLNQILVEMDGFDATTGLIILAATNRPEILDPALLRPGRFDRQVLVDRPDRKGRLEILAVHLRKLTAYDPDLDLEQIAALSTGFSGADIANLVNEAALVATRRKAERVELKDFTEAVDRIVAGLERRSRVLSVLERRMVAYHEMGHALVGFALRASSTVRKVSIIPRGLGALGYTIERPTEDRFIATKTELEARLAMLLGGRVAESLEFGQLSTGAASDLTSATSIARSMVLRYGMEEGLGHVNYENQEGFYGSSGSAGRPHSEETAREVDIAVKRILAEAYARAEKILTKDRALLTESAEELLNVETFNEEMLAAYFSRLSAHDVNV